MFAELLRQRLGSVAELSPNQIEKLEQHFLLLQRWNKTLNLTSLHRADEIIERHYCESIFLGVHLPAKPLHIADVGSGAGFPGFPLAIVRPDCSVSLVESHQRKGVFLREATRNLSNANVLSVRVEDVHENFDWVVCRAVKLSEIEKPVSKIAVSLAILGGEDHPPASCFTWNEPIRLPWGRRRYLWIGTRRST